MQTKTEIRKRRSRHKVTKVFRWDPEVVEWLKSMSNETGYTMTEIVETCVRAVGRDVSWLIKDFRAVSPDNAAFSQAVKALKQRRLENPEHQ